MDDLEEPRDVPPHDDDLDVEAPNESAPGHNPPEDSDDGSEAA